MTGFEFERTTTNKNGDVWNYYFSIGRAEIAALAFLVVTVAGLILWFVK